jgi:prepilin-type N-terminal cleavage/methylation domain-containing protein
MINKKNPAFTLIEVLVAVTIIAVLTAIGVVSYASANRNSRDAKRLSDVEQIRAALEMYRADVGQYPESITPGDSLVSGSNTYMSPIPQDPKPSSGCEYSYISDGQNYTLGVCLEKEAGETAYFTPMGQISVTPTPELTLAPSSTPTLVPTSTPTPAPTTFPTPRKKMKKTIGLTLVEILVTSAIVTMGDCPDTCFFDSDCSPCGSGCTCPFNGGTCQCPF